MTGEPEETAGLARTAQQVADGAHRPVPVLGRVWWRTGLSTVYNGTGIPEPVSETIRVEAWELEAAHWHPGLLDD